MGLYRIRPGGLHNFKSKVYRPGDVITLTDAEATLATQRGASLFNRLLRVREGEQGTVQGAQAPRVGASTPLPTESREGAAGAPGQGAEAQEPGKPSSAAATRFEVVDITSLSAADAINWGLHATDKDALFAAYDKEDAAKKPRKSVVQVLEARIVALGFGQSVADGAAAIPQEGDVVQDEGSDEGDAEDLIDPNDSDVRKIES